MKDVLYYNNGSYVGKGGTYNTTFENHLLSGGYFSVCDVDITLKNGTVYNLNEADIIQGSLTIDASMGSSEIQLGGIVAKTVTFKLNNLDGRWDNIDFNGAEVVVKCGLTPEYQGTKRYLVHMGVYYVDEYEKPDDIITVKAIDGTQFLDSKIDNDNIGVSLSEVFNRVAKTSYLGGGTLSGNYSKSTGGKTYRELLSALLSQVGAFAYISNYMNYDNALVVDSFENVLNSKFEQYTIGANFRYSVKTKAPQTISGFFGTNRSIDKGRIGIYYTGTGKGINSILYKDNDAFTGGSFNISSRELNLTPYPTTYTPYTLVFPGNPRLDIRDRLSITNTKDGTIKIPIFNYSYTLGGNETISLDPTSELFSYLDIVAIDTFSKSSQKSVNDSGIQQAFLNKLKTKSNGSGESVLTGTNGNWRCQITTNKYVYYESSNTLRLAVSVYANNTSTGQEARWIEYLYFDLDNATFDTASSRYRAEYQNTVSTKLQNAKYPFIKQAIIQVPNQNATNQLFTSWSMTSYGRMYITVGTSSSDNSIRLEYPDISGSSTSTNELYLAYKNAIIQQGGYIYFS